mmetsp:Transcript_19475/g.42016  ORF Transcript_19475/g.42016 Transcript_19475/m.42016 type:complete len:215 (-) Transcript_19475:933-1577(-)
MKQLVVRALHARRRPRDGVLGQAKAEHAHLDLFAQVCVLRRCRAQLLQPCVHRCQRRCRASRRRVLVESRHGFRVLGDELRQLLLRCLLSLQTEVCLLLGEIPSRFNARACTHLHACAHCCLLLRSRQCVEVAYGAPFADAVVALAMRGHVALVEIVHLKLLRDAGSRFRRDAAKAVEHVVKAPKVALNSIVDIVRTQCSGVLLGVEVVSICTV